MLAVVAAEARAFPAGVVALVGVRWGAVDVDLARLDVVGHLHGGTVVLGEYHRSKAKLVVVGQLQGFIHIGVGQHRQYRAEDLLLDDFHVLAAVGQQGRWVEVSGARGNLAAGRQGGAVVDGSLDHLVDVEAGVLVDQGPHVVRVLGTIAEAAGFHVGLEQGDEGLGNGLVHVDPFDGGAQLAAVGGLGGHDLAGGLLEVGVGFDDGRRLAAQLQRRLGDVDLRVLQYLATGADAAGEGDHADPWVSTHGLGGGVVHAQDVDHPRRDLGRLDGPGNFEGRTRSVVARAHDHAVAGDHRRGNLAQQGEDGVVEGNQAGHHADRLPSEQQALVRGVAGHDIALDPSRPFGVVAGDIGRVYRLVGGVLEALARLFGQRPPNGLATLYQGVGQALHMYRPLGTGQPAPVLLGPGCDLDSFHRLGVGGGLDLAHHRSRGGAVDRDHAGLRDADKVVVDEIPIGAHG